MPNAPRHKLASLKNQENSECRVFSALTKIVVAKHLENTISFGSNVFEGFLTRFYELYMHI
jgi:hypothetical protein